MRNRLSYILWYLFWVSTVLSSTLAPHPFYGTCAAAVSLITLLIYVWASKEPLEDAYLMRHGVYVIQIIGMLIAAFYLKNGTYCMIAGVAFLIHYHKEGGSYYAEQSA